MAEKQILDLQAESTRLSYDRYKRLYEDFRSGQAHSEDLLLTFLSAMSKEYAPTTMWTMFSHLRKYLLLECVFDLGPAERITHFLKTLARHHKKKQAPAFTRDELFRFLREGPSEGKGLISKIVMLLGFYAGLRGSEIVALIWDDISFSTDGVLVRIQKSKTDRAGIGALKLLPKLEEAAICPFRYFCDYKNQVRVTCGRLLCQFQKGKFTKMPVGKNAIAGVPKQIAMFLGLENTGSYTGHALRVTSATVMADEGAGILELKRHGRWASDSIAEGYVRESKQTRQNAATLLAGQPLASIAKTTVGEGSYQTFVIQNCVFNGTVFLSKDPNIQ